MKEACDVSLLRRLRGVARLAEAAAQSDEANADVWQFSLPIDVLRNHTGLSNGDLRSLIAKGLVEHRIETTRSLARTRTFRRTGPMNPATRVCFVLSSGGVQYVRKVCEMLEGLEKSGVYRPCWDSATGNLTCGGKLVRHIPKKAFARRAILDSAEAAKWENPIVSPFANMSPRRRDHYMRRLLDQLNHGQQEATIHFSSIEKGRLFQWSTA